MGLLFTLLGIYFIRDKDYFWGFITTLVGTVIWYICAASIMETEIAYQLFNATSGNIETDIQVASSKIAPEMLYFFYMMATIMFLLNVTVLFTGLWDYIKKRKE